MAKVLGQGQHQNGPVSPMSTSSDISTNNRGVSGYSEVFEDDSLGFLHTPASYTTDQKGRLSPLPHYESGGSSLDYSHRQEMNYGRFYQKSYLDSNGTQSFKKGPSVNPADPQKRHFIQPENFSYRQVRRDFVRPMKKENSSMLSAFGDQNLLSKKPVKLEPVMKNQDAIRLARFPDGHEPEEGKTAAIEREDWPAPPDPAAAYPELFRDYRLRKSKASEENAVEEKTPKPVDPKIQREINELAKINSGVGHVILKHLEKKKTEEPVLDPRSASRTPAADREPSYRTRYMSPVFASPSRDNQYKTKHYSLDDMMIGRKYRTSPLPMTNFGVPKPGYGLRVAAVPSSRRSEGYVSEGYLTDEERHQRDYFSMLAPDVSVTHDRHSHRSDMERRSYHTSQSSVEDSMYDPETGLRRSRYRSSGTSDHFSSSYLPFRRSIPSFKSDEPVPIFPYEQLRISNPSLPQGADINSLERHLSRDEFESIFHMNREDFYRLAEWKRNDMKKRVQLY